jgi:hypothetical protein
VRCGSQGWDDAQQVASLVLLMLAGGDAVDDLDVLNADDGLMQLWRKYESHGLRGKERRSFLRRFRRGRTRSVPSPTAARDYLAAFHDREEELRRVHGTAFIPKPNTHLQGLYRVIADAVGFAQRCRPHPSATLDMDATLVESGKREALFCYKGFQAYQPLNVYWAEHGMVVHSEFRDGNVPAGYEQLPVFSAALEHLPASVGSVRLRADTAGYEWALLRYCAEGRNKRFGRIEFAVGADVTEAFKRAVAEVPENDWRPLQRVEDGMAFTTGQEWTEVCYVPGELARSKRGPVYRFLAVREAMQQRELPGMERSQAELPFSSMDFGAKGRHKLFGIVTNHLEMPGDELIWWHRGRCGDSEKAHAIMKSDLAGGTMPSGLFGANAAWWSIMILAYNVTALTQRYLLAAGWATKRLKALRFAVFNIAGRVYAAGRRLIIAISQTHPALELLLGARQRLQMVVAGPDG